MNQNSNALWRPDDWGPEHPLIQEAFNAALSEQFKTRHKHGLPRSTKTAYHYTDGAGLRGIIENNCLWATNARYCNDKTETKHGQDIIKKAINELLSSSEEAQRQTFWNEFAKHFTDAVTEDLTRTDSTQPYCCCFSQNPDRLSQWRGYGGKGLGYSISFDTKRLAQESQRVFILSDVSYTDPVKSEIAKQTLLTFITFLEKKSSPEKYKEQLPNVMMALDSISYILASAFKHEGFHEEKEFRLIGHASTSLDFKYVNYREKNGLIIPFMEIKPLPDKLLPITEIIVGPCLEYDRAKLSLKMLLQSKGYHNVEIKPSLIPFLP